MFDFRLSGALRQPITYLALALLACGGGTSPAQSPADPDSDEPAATSALDGSGSGASNPEEGSADADSSPQDAPGEPTEPEDTDGDDFRRLNTGTAKQTHGVKKSNLAPTKTEALLKFVVVDKGKGEPIEGIVISLTGPDGKKYYTKPTDAVGFADVLVPAGQEYEVVYLSLRGKDIAANLNVEDKERYTLKLTLRYKGWVRPPGESAQRLVLKGVHFDTGKATIRPGSYSRLDSIVEYMQHKRDARIEISGHTDNVGSKSSNKQLSKRRAEACRDYLISKGIDKSRITAVGYGDERPIASNKTAAGRQKNRRIEAEEL